MLVDGNRTVFETTSIIEYLALRHPGKAPLLPVEPDAALAERTLDRVFDNYVMGPMQEIVAAHIRSPGLPDLAIVGQARDTLEKAYRWLNGSLERRSCDGSVSLVECALHPRCSMQTGSVRSQWNWTGCGNGGLISSRSRPSPAASMKPGRTATSSRQERRTATSKEPLMHELSVSRHIAAPPAGVWRVMTERIEEWWCPKPWRAVFDKLDRHPGGASLVTMYGPAGEVMPHNGYVLAWDEGQRFAFTDAIKPDLMPDGPFMIGIWEIAPEGDGTRYTARARHWSEETKKHHLEMGFEEGWGACADQLAALCEAA